MTPYELFSASVGNFGFPLVLSIYLLIRFEKRIETLTSAIYDLMQVVDRDKK
ncbi:YvrJ family protein [Bacillus megaterium]|nr:YvrJ family protein [Priestia megaterium]NGY85318.1 YvrJ family protein [Priestia megaterium]